MKVTAVTVKLLLLLGGLQPPPGGWDGPSVSDGVRLRLRAHRCYNLKDRSHKSPFLIIEFQKMTRQCILELYRIIRIL